MQLMETPPGSSPAQLDQRLEDTIKSLDNFRGSIVSNGITSKDLEEHNKQPSRPSLVERKNEPTRNLRGNRSISFGNMQPEEDNHSEDRWKPPEVSQTIKVHHETDHEKFMRNRKSVIHNKMASAQLSEQKKKQRPSIAQKRKSRASTGAGPRLSELHIDGQHDSDDSDSSGGGGRKSKLERQKRPTILCRSDRLSLLGNLLPTGDSRPSMAVKEEFGVDLTDEQVTELRGAFSLFDADGSGAITALELRDVMGSLGMVASLEDLEDMIAEVDEDESGEIEFPEFVRLMANQLLAQGSVASRLLSAHSALKASMGCDTLARLSVVIAEHLRSTSQKKGGDGSEYTSDQILQYELDEYAKRAMSTAGVLRRQTPAGIKVSELPQFHFVMQRAVNPHEREPDIRDEKAIAPKAQDPLLEWAMNKLDKSASNSAASEISVSAVQSGSKSMPLPGAPREDGGKVNKVTDSMPVGYKSGKKGPTSKLGQSKQMVAAHTGQIGQNQDISAQTNSDPSDSDDPNNDKLWKEIQEMSYKATEAIKTGQLRKNGDFDDLKRENELLRRQVAQIRKCLGLKDENEDWQDEQKEAIPTQSDAGPFVLSNDPGNGATNGFHHDITKSQGLQSQALQSQALQSQLQGLQSQALPSQGLQSQGLQLQGLLSQNLQSQGLPPQGLQSQGMQYQGLQSQLQGLLSQGSPSQGLQSQRLPPQGLQSQGLQSPGFQAQGLQSQGLLAQGFNSPGLQSQGLQSQRLSPAQEALARDDTIRSQGLSAREAPFEREQTASFGENPKTVLPVRGPEAAWKVLQPLEAEVARLRAENQVLHDMQAHLPPEKYIKSNGFGDEFSKPGMLSSPGAPLGRRDLVGQFLGQYEGSETSQDHRRHNGPQPQELMMLPRTPPGNDFSRSPRVQGYPGYGNQIWQKEVPGQAYQSKPPRGFVRGLITGNQGRHS